MIADSLLKLIQNYFDGLYYGNTKLLSYIFHPQAICVDATTLSPVSIDIKTYLSQLTAQPSAASEVQIRCDEIVEVKRIGDTMAYAVVRFVIGKNQYHDVLTLLQVNQQWQIMSKVFSQISAVSTLNKAAA